MRSTFFHFIEDLFLAWQAGVVIIQFRDNCLGAVEMELLLRPFRVVAISRLVFIFIPDRAVRVEHFVDEVLFQPLAVGVDILAGSLLRDIVR